jgi:hypothetical protein
VWATGAQPPSRADPVAVTASLALLLVAVAVAGSAVVAATRAPARRHARVGAAAMGAVLLLGPATWGWWASGRGLAAMTSLQQVPGVALFRDQHRLLAVGVLAQAVLVALAVRSLARHAGDAAAALGTTLVVALAVASVPDLPGTVGSGYRPVSYPAEWDAVTRAVDGGGTRPVVLSLPWQPLRLPAWAGDPAFLDPLPRAVEGEVLVSTALTVQRGSVVVEVDDAPTGEAWASGEVSTASLRRHGITHVVEWIDTPGQLASSHDGWRLVHSGANFRVWDVTAPL